MQPSTQILPSRDIDETSSFGDDESDHGMLNQNDTANGHVADQDDMMTGLPDALAGQDIEDLAYGAGSNDFELERGGAFGTGWWSSSDEEEEDGVSQDINYYEGVANYGRSTSTIYQAQRTKDNQSRPLTTMLQMP